MHWITTALLLLGATVLHALFDGFSNRKFQGVSVNTSTSGMDEADGTVSVPGKGYISNTLVGPHDPRLTPPKSLPPTNGIMIVSNSHVGDGVQQNKVDTKVESFGNSSRPAAGPRPGGRPQSSSGIIRNLIPNIAPVPAALLQAPLITGVPGVRSQPDSPKNSSIPLPLHSKRIGRG